MRIHHLNGATLCPVGRRLILGRPDGLLVCHCLLIETDAAHPSCPMGPRLMQSVLEMKRPERRNNQERLRELVRTRSGQVRVFCAHDEEEFKRLTGTQPLATSSSESRAARG